MNKIDFDEVYGNIESVSCPICGSNKYIGLYEFHPFSVKRCLRCGNGYLSPRYTEQYMMRVYSRDDYFLEGEYGYAENYDVQEASLKITYKRLLRNLDKLGVLGGDLLEIGCGPGYFLDTANPYFENLTGTDYSDWAIKNAGRKANIIKGGVDDLPAGSKYDVIVANQVIEHVYQPEVFIRKLQQFLSKSGVVILTTPKFDGLIYKIFRKKWPSFKIPEHVIYWTKKGLQKHLEQCGFILVKSFSYLHAFPVNVILRNMGADIEKPLGTNIWLPETSFCIVVRNNYD